VNTKLAAALAAIALAATASAAPTESRRRGSFEFGAGPYRPSIDDEFNSSAAPYDEIFGGGQPWGFRLLLARALYTRHGALELGFKTGFWQDKGNEIAEDGTRTADETALRIIPTSLTLTYRWDWLSVRYGIPFAFYGRGAFERYNWWVTDRDETAKKGATMGWSATGGVAFLLDIVDRSMARELDNDSGVNDTWIFFDVTTDRIDDFGSSKSWDMSSDGFTYSTGITFVF
jgi:hypothetical protein